jgi:pyruvate kinase
VCEVTATDVDGGTVTVKVMNNAELGQNKGVNLPGK